MKLYRITIGDKIIEPVKTYEWTFYGGDRDGKSSDTFISIKGCLENGKIYDIVSSYYHPIIIEEL